MKKRVSVKFAVGAVYVLAMFMSALDSTIVNVALPAIGGTFHVPPEAMGTINIGYLISLAMFLPAAGWMGDRFGTKRIFLSAIGIFTIASVLCGFAHNMFTLNVYRILQGIGAGFITPVGMAILFRTFTHEERPKLSRMLIIPIALAPALGPIIGGFLVDTISWRWIFFINIPIGLLALFIGKVYLQEHVEPTAGAFDYKGFILSLTGFSLSIYSLTQGTVKGWTSPEIIVTGCLGLVLMVLLVRLELREDKPLIDVRLFKDPMFRSMSFIGLCSAAGLLGMLYVFPLMYQNALNVSAFHTGLTTFIEALGLMVASQLMPWTLKKMGLRRLLIFSLIGTIIVFMLISLFVASNPWLLRFLMFGIGFFLGQTVGAAQISAFKNIDFPSMGRATMLFNMQNRLGAVLGVAILSGVLGTSNTSTGEQVNLLTYQYALFGASIFLIVACLIAVRMNKTTENDPTLHLNLVEKAE
ncbi:MDR family MFS transporter [Sporosarcina sp. P29]|uniref:MDR family MFS transporter n=1 Tax=Sporosarcina sp. P29 TaxID=2048252 RepID=UPI000C16B2FD|nr:MDR family MFS transporter [Sporosarcina sp. P29]PID00687.1 MFS transporter [Sporosarcina sp. P29]